MADANTDHQALAQSNAATGLRRTERNPIDTFMQSHVVRHFGRLIGLAMAVAIGTVVVLWSFEPNYAPLYSNVSSQDASEIANVLTANQIEYKIETGGSILVAQNMIAQARLKLAAEGLPRGTTKGLEMLQDDQGLGTSQFIESARYNHALETELARSIEAIRSVEEARVHLALPKQSIFIRNRTKPSASVVTKLYSGRRLNQGQVDAIVHMVAASIPMMDADQVTVVDQFGRLLTADQDSDMAQTSKQFEYTRKLEDSYAERIVQLLQPIVGEGKVTAQVSASLDFSQVESTREAYDPERSVIRSEQVREQEMRDLNAAEGIPGALSNQPPGSGTTDPAAVNSATGGSPLPATQNRSATRNFEVDRMISHTRNPSGSVQRLSVAVLVDSLTTVNADGSTQKTPYTDEDIARFESLVKETIGFNQNRGDSVSVINQPFVPNEVVLEETPAWKSLLNEGWIVTLAKQVFGAIGLLIVYLLFGRPFLRSLSLTREAGEREEGGENDQGAGGSNRQGGQYGGELSGPSSLSAAGMPFGDDANNTAAMIRRSDATHEQKVGMAKTLVMDDPARVANVVNNWVTSEQ